MKKAFYFKTIAHILIFAFGMNIIFIPSAHAEKPCWNDGAIASAVSQGSQADTTGDGNFRKVGTQDVDDPVNLSSGNYSYEARDITIPSVGLNLELTRFYNNQDGYEGPFGVGWSHNCNIFLLEAEEDGVKYVILRRAEGRKDRFIESSPGVYSAPSGVFDSLFKDGQGYYIRTKYGHTYRFNSVGYLGQIIDRNNNQLSLAYDAKGRLIKIADNWGRDIRFEYSAENKITGLKDFTGRSWAYTYEGRNLKTVTTPATVEFPNGMTTVYNYSGSSLTSIIDAKGQTYAVIEYDLQNRVDKLYLDGAAYDFNFAANQTVTSNRRGFSEAYNLNPDGTVNTKQDIALTQYSYNANKQVTKVVYPRGNYVQYSYDSQGNLTELRRKKIGAIDTPDPANDIVSGFSYEPNYNFIKSATDAQGNATTYYYDYEEAVLGDLNADGITNENRGNLVKIAYPAVSAGTPAVTFTYNPNGQIQTAAAPNGVVTRYEYDTASGYLKKSTNDYGGTNCLNITTQFTYDRVGSVISVTDPKGNAAIFEYNALNQLIQTESPAPFSYKTKYSYDANGNLAKVERQVNNTASRWQAVTYSYTVLDRLRAVTDDINHTTAFSYDSNGNRTAVTDANNNFTTYAYDQRDRLSKTIDALGNVTEYSYDENDNLIQIKDASGSATGYVYDDFERLIKTVYADNSYEGYSYDKNSNLASKRTRRGDTINYSYDALNRLLQKALPEGITNYTYDIASRLIRVEDNASRIQYGYDSIDRIVRVQVRSPKTAAIKTVRYLYDANSNRTKLIYPDGIAISYRYDELNRLKRILDGQNNTIAQYSYDVLSQRTGLAYPNTTAVSYNYDAVNRLTSIDQLGGSIRYSYDKVGNRLTKTDSGGKENYTYDKAYQLLKTVYPGSVKSTYVYDETGNRTKTVTAGVTTRYTANNLNQYTKVNKIDYVYDGNGSLTSDGANTYAYDSENRLITATAPSYTAAYTYDPFGRRLTKDEGGGTIRRYLYDGDQVICEYDKDDNLTTKFIYGPGIDEPIRMEKGGNTYYYHFDGLGSVIGLTDSTGAVVESYSYDVYGQPNAASTIGNPYMFTGREYDAETNLYYYRARYYSPAIGRFLQTDPVGYFDHINPYIYAFNNPINFVDSSGLSGYIIIHSEQGDNRVSSFGFGNHAWIEYRKDGTNSVKMYGTWGHSQGGHKGFREDTPAEYMRSGFGVIRTKHINDDRERRMLWKIQEFRKIGEKAWSYYSACPKFATDVWEAATGEDLQDRHLWGLGYSDPNVLVETIKKANQKDEEKKQSKKPK